ncbi:MAG: tetratricopeptide repeat protein [Nitrosomonadales bacterium]|nr:tetratricopeptide repeat protein [Nitrosomonadales bacterium]
MCRQLCPLLLCALLLPSTKVCANPEAPAIRIEHRQNDDALTPQLRAGWQAYRAGDLATARQHYEQALLLDARNRDALLGLSAIALQQNEDADAAHHLVRAIELDPRDPIAQAGLATLNGEIETESRIKLLLVPAPDAALLFALGNLYAARSDWSAARLNYAGACQLAPDFAPCAHNLAVSLDHLGQYPQAAHHYQRALQLDARGTSGFDAARVRQRLDALSQR